MWTHRTGPEYSKIFKPADSHDFFVKSRGISKWQKANWAVTVVDCRRQDHRAACWAFRSDHRTTRVPRPLLTRIHRDLTISSDSNPSSKRRSRPSSIWRRRVVAAKAELRPQLPPTPTLHERFLVSVYRLVTSANSYCTAMIHRYESFFRTCLVAKLRPRSMQDIPPPMPVPVEVHRVTLFKDKIYDDFGFSISDGLFERGIYVNRIRPKGPADMCGLLRPFDRILQVSLDFVVTPFVSPDNRKYFSPLHWKNNLERIRQGKQFFRPQINDHKTHNMECCTAVPLVAASGDTIELIISRPASYCLPSSYPDWSQDQPWLEDGGSTRSSVVITQTL